MSPQSPAPPLPAGESHTAARPRSDRDVLGLVLGKILQQALDNLKHELCPTQPRSVSAKAADLARILPDWEDRARAHSGDLGREQEVCRAVIEAAARVVGSLKDLVAAETREDECAAACLKNLKRDLKLAIKTLINEFRATLAATPLPAPAPPAGEPGASNGVLANPTKPAEPRARS